MELKFKNLRLLQCFDKLPLGSGSAGFLAQCLPFPTRAPALGTAFHHGCVPLCYQIGGPVLTCVSSIANELMGDLDFLLCDLLRFQERGGQDSSSWLLTRNSRTRVRKPGGR